MVTAAMQSDDLAGSTGKRLNGLAAESDKPSSGSSITREPESPSVSFERLKPVTTPTVSISTSDNFRIMSSEVPLVFHPVSNIEAISSAESMFLGILRKYGEAQAILLAKELGFDISRFYPE